VSLVRTELGVLVCVLPVLALSACESTQQRSARLKAAGVRELGAQKGLRVTQRNPDVRVVGTAVLRDENGVAVVVALRNRADRPLGRVPVAIDVRGAGGKSVYRNDQPGLDPSLVEASALPGRGELLWVDDQVTASGTPRRVVALAGRSRRTAPRSLPRIELSAPRLSEDPATGIEAVGVVRNASRVDQKRLVVFCVARRGGKVVAAGRAIVQRLAAGKHARYHVFFIGDPRGARLTVAAPPAVLA
jgi:hypothetical protein